MVLRKLLRLILNHYFRILTHLIFKPQCSYGPHNPAIDVGCANCGFIPNYRRAHAVKEHQAKIGSTSQILSSDLVLSITNNPTSMASPRSAINSELGPNLSDSEHFPATTPESYCIGQSHDVVHQALSSIFIRDQSPMPPLA